MNARLVLVRHGEISGEAMSTSDFDLSSVIFGLAIGILLLIWIGRLFWIVTASLRRRDNSPEPGDHLSAADDRFLRSLHIKP